MGSITAVPRGWGSYEADAMANKSPFFPRGFSLLLVKLLLLLLRLLLLKLEEDDARLAFASRALRTLSVSSFTETKFYI